MLFGLAILLININLINAGQFYYNVSINYYHGNLSINSVKVIFSQYELTPFSGNYILELKNSNNKLNSYTFNVPNTVSYHIGGENSIIMGGGIIVLNETNFEIFIPYDERIDQMVVTDSNKLELAKKDMSYLSKNVVSSQITKEFETLKNKSETNIYSNNATNSKNYLIIGMVILIIIIIMIIIFWIIKKPDKLKNKN